MSVVEARFKVQGSKLKGCYGERSCTMGFNVRSSGFRVFPMAHLHLGLLAYWLVNTIRFKLKAHGINNNWCEIVRIGNTQKIITTYGTNKAGIGISVRNCS